MTLCLWDSESHIRIRLIFTTIIFCAHVFAVCEATLTSCFIENNPSKVLDAKLSLIVVLWWDVVCVEFVLEVELVQHCGVCSLQEIKREKKRDYLAVGEFDLISHRSETHLTPDIHSVCHCLYLPK